jgi:hypothetical protein
MKNKKSKKEEIEAERFRIVIYLLAFFLILFLFSKLIFHFFEGGTGIEKCKGIIFQSFREDCFQKLAQQTKNISICNFTINKENCLISIAISQKNISICNFVGIRCVNSLINLISQDECLKLSGNLKDYCLIGKAYNATNNSICNLIENSTAKKLCQGIILQKQIMASKNFSICENLSDIEKLVCLQIVAKNLNTSIPTNYLVNYSSFYLNASVFNVSNISGLTAAIGNLSIIGKALHTKNLSLCSTLQRNQSILCYLLFALNTTNIDICNYLPPDEVNACKQLVSFYISRV